LDHELGMGITDLECVLPDFGYRATDASGLVENEFCPVFRAHVRIDPESSHPNDPPLANPDEVLDWKWWKWNDVIEAARLTPFVFSPWSVQQMAQLSRSAAD
jgi:isopentenyl-diphosphate delta-isomerase